MKKGFNDEGFMAYVTTGTALLPIRNSSTKTFGRKVSK